MGFESAATTEMALAQVSAASSMTMKYAVSTPGQLTQAFQEARDSGASSAPLSCSNTFLNFAAPASPKHPRSRSSCCPCRVQRRAQEPEERESTMSPDVGAVRLLEASQQQQHSMATMISDAPPREQLVVLSTVPMSASLPASDTHSSESSPTNDGGSSGVKDIKPPPSRRMRRKLRNAAGQTNQTSQAVPLTAPPPSPAAGANEYTTVMLQNLPKVFTQRDLMHSMAESGFAKMYNFCYVPVSFQDGSCRGYGFVNFHNHKSAAAFISTWHGSLHFCDSCHCKPLAAIVAEMQGLEALLAQPSMKKLQRVRNPAYRPFIAREAGC